MKRKKIDYVKTEEINIERIGKRLIIKPGQSIQDGIEIAEEYDTVLVRIGEYFETLMTYTSLPNILI